MKSILRAVLLAAGVLAAHAGAMAQAAWPTKPIKLIVPFAPGGSADGSARVIVERLGAVLGQPIVIDNRPGGYATVGAAIAAKADPDGYTLFYMPGTHVLTPKLSAATPYHPVNDFTPITNVVFAPFVIIGTLKDGRATLKEVAQYARDNPGAMSIGNSEVTTRLGAESFSQAAKVKLTHVNYKGGGPATTDVLGGHLQLAVVTSTAAAAFHKDKRLYALAVTSPVRMATLPDVPTVAEALGVPNFDSQTWYALTGPAKLPRPVVDRISKAVAQVLAEKETRDRILNIGLVPADNTTPEGLSALMKNFALQNNDLIESAKLKME